MPNANQTANQVDVTCSLWHSTTCCSTRERRGMFTPIKRKIWVSTVDLHLLVAPCMCLEYLDHFLFILSCSVLCCSPSPTNPLLVSCRLQISFRMFLGVLRNAEINTWWQNDDECVYTATTQVQSEALMLMLHQLQSTVGYTRWNQRRQHIRCACLLPTCRVHLPTTDG